LSAASPGRAIDDQSAVGDLLATLPARPAVKGDALMQLGALCVVAGLQSEAGNRVFFAEGSTGHGDAVSAERY
jgi:hypothetical protein